MKIENLTKRPTVQSFLGICVIAGVFIYIVCITFFKVPKENQNNVNYSLAFLSNIAGLVMGFFFGSSKKQDERPAEVTSQTITKTKTIKDPEETI